MHWLWVHVGLSSGNSPWYLLPSGWGSILIPPLLTAGPIVAVLLRRHNCHVHGCWRLGLHCVEGTTYVVCRRHHPGSRPTAAHIREQYHLYLGDRPGRG